MRKNARLSYPDLQALKNDGAFPYDQGHRQLFAIAAQREVVRMLLHRDSMALMGGRGILGHTHGSLLSMKPHHPLWFKPNPNTNKSRGATGNSGNADKSGFHPLGETAHQRTESVVANVAVWATSKRTTANSKVSRNQSIVPADTRHELGSIASVANVACPSPGDSAVGVDAPRTGGFAPPAPTHRARSMSNHLAGSLPSQRTNAAQRTTVAQTAETSRTSKAPMKWALERLRDVSREPARTRGNPRSRSVVAPTRERRSRFERLSNCSIVIP